MNKTLFVIVALLCLASATQVYGKNYGSLTATLVTQPIQFDSEQRVYTPFCLTDCHMVLNMSYKQNVDLSRVDISFYKDKIIGSDILNAVLVDYLENVSYAETLTYSKYTCVNGTVLGNGTIPQICTNNPYSVTTEKWKLSWLPFPPAKNFVKDTQYFIDIKGIKKAVVGFVAIDIVPVIAGTNLTGFAWWNASWGYRINMTLKSSVSTNETLPRNVTLNTASLITAGKLQSDCDDLRFTNESDLEIPYFIESGCGTTNTTIWFKTQTASANTSLIWVYYGNPSASSGQNENGVFDANYLGAWGMSEGTGTSTFHDSTSNAKTVNMTSVTWYNGMFGNATGYNGASSMGVTQGTIPSGETSVTIETWAYIGNMTGLGGIVVKGGSTAGRQFGIIQYNAGGCSGLLDAIVFNPVETQGCFNEYPTGRWVYLVGRWNGTYTDTFINGTMKSNTSVASMTTYTTNFVFGRHALLNYWFGGYLDNVRYSDVARSNNNIKMVYDTATKSALTSTWGTEQSGTVTPTVNLTINSGVGNITSEYYSGGSTFNITAWSSDPVYWVAILRNGTTIANGTGATTVQAELGAGFYNITSINNASMSATLWINVTKQKTYCDLLLLPPSPLVYPYPVTALCVCYGYNDLNQTPTNLYRNGTNVNATENYADTVIGAGFWNYTCNTTGTTNYTSNNTVIDNMTMNQNQNDLWFSIQNSTGTYGGWNGGVCGTIGYDINETYPNQVNISGYVPSGTGTLWLNSTNITANNNQFVTYVGGVHSMIRFNATSNANYSYNCSENYLNIKQGTPTINITFDTADTVVQNTSVAITCNKPNGLSVTMYNDTASITNPYIYNTSATGTYNFTCNSTANANYSSATTTHSLAVTLVGGLVVTTYNEQAYTSTMLFNITAFNSTISDTKLNQNPYQNNTLSGDVTIYLTANGYPQRNRYVSILANSTVLIDTYLLQASAGQYVSFYIQSYQGQPIVNALVQAGELLGSNWQIIDEEKTDSSGIATLFLNYNNLHTISIQYAGTWYLVNSSLIPSQTLYRYYINPTNATKYTTEYSNLAVTISPQSLSLPMSTQSQVFSCSVLSSDSQLNWYGLKIILPNTTTYLTNTSSSTGGTVSRTFNLTQLYLSGQYNLSYDCFFAKQNFSQTELTLYYYIYNDTGMAGSGSLEHALSSAQGIGLGLVALGIISLVISGLVGGFLGRFNSLAGGLTCIIMLGFMWYYLGMFAVAPFQIGGVYLLICLTTVSVIYLRGGI